MEPEPLLGLPASRAAARQWLGQRVVVPSDEVAVLDASSARSLTDLESTPDRVRYIVADCVLWSWSSGQLAQLARTLAGSNPETSQRLLFLEPSAGLGWRDRIQQRSPWLWRRRYGHDFRRDIPAELRSHGLTVTTTVRFREGPVRHYVVGEARHYRHLDRPPPEPAADYDPAMQSLVDQAVSDLAGRLGVGPEAITVVSAEMVQWPDSANGCPQPGMRYLQVVTDGSELVLAVGNDHYRYTTGGKNSTPVLCPS